jgi:methyltransferase family protein
MIGSSSSDGSDPRVSRVVRAIRYRSRPLLEAIGAPILFLALFVVRAYRPTFHRTSRWIYLAADWFGIYPVLDHYHDPPVRPTSSQLAGGSVARHIDGLDLRPEEQVAWLRRLADAEPMAMVLERIGDDRLAPVLNNLAFAPADAMILFALLRVVRPGRVVEVGSGHSTRFAKAALDLNRVDGGDVQHLCIEPYESLWLEEMGITVIREPVEDLAIDFFRELGSGDVLFIDSSHVVRPGGDVLHLIHHVLPQLPKGVIVHIHDMFTPRDYPARWQQRRWFWTEQYLVEALLVGNERYRIILGANYLFHDHRADMLDALPEVEHYLEREPASLWLEVVQ